MSVLLFDESWETVLGQSDGAKESLIGLRATRAEAAGFVFGHWVSPSGAEEMRPHGHGDGHFVFVTEGNFTSDAEGGENDQSILIYNPPGTYHRDRFNGGGAFFAIHVPEMAQEAAREYALPLVPTRLTGRSRAVVRCLMRECANWQPESKLSSEAACLELLSHTGRPCVAEANEPVWLVKAQDLLRAADPTPPSIEAVAKAIGVHPIHLARTFRKFLGCTPGDYLRTFRVRRAAHLLRSTKRSVAELALAAGFADQSHMTRSFRCVYGVGPSGFRRMVT